MNQNKKRSFNETNNVNKFDNEPLSKKIKLNSINQISESDFHPFEPQPMSIFSKIPFPSPLNSQNQTNSKQFNPLPLITKPQIISKQTNNESNFQHSIDNNLINQKLNVPSSNSSISKSSSTSDSLSVHSSTSDSSSSDSSSSDSSSSESVSRASSSESSASSGSESDHHSDASSNHSSKKVTKSKTKTKKQRIKMQKLFYQSYEEGFILPTKSLELITTKTIRPTLIPKENVNDHHELKLDCICGNHLTKLKLNKQAEKQYWGKVTTIQCDNCHQQIPYGSEIYACIDAKHNQYSNWHGKWFKQCQNKHGELKFVKNV